MFFHNESKILLPPYYNAKKASGVREDLYAKVALLKQKAEATPEKCLNDEECRKYLIIRKSEKLASGYIIRIRKDILEKYLCTSGLVVLISNNIPDALQAMSAYCDKDVVEKSFLRLKNSIDLGQLRFHSDNVMQGKLFVGFFPSILMVKHLRLNFQQDKAVVIILPRFQVIIISTFPCLFLIVIL